MPVPGGEVRVRRHHLGGAQAVPVLFVHGAFVNSHLWDGVIDHLVALGVHRSTSSRQTFLWVRTTVE